MDGKENHLVTSRLPTEYGEFVISAFESGDVNMPHIVLSNLPEFSPEVVNVRIHSECMTGDVFGSRRCDCGEQLDGSLRFIGEHGGLLIYLRQEGRGIGLVNKLNAYNLQDQGMDTVDANHALGFETDERIFTPAIEILTYFRILKINLITNNPEKMDAFSHSGIEVVSRIPIIIPPHPDNKEYLAVKLNRMGHLLHQ